MKQIASKEIIERILLVLLIVSCILGGLGYASIDLGVLILTPARMCMFVVALYCGVTLLIRLCRKQIPFGEWKSVVFRLCMVAFFFVWSVCAVIWMFFAELPEYGDTEVMGIMSLFMYSFSFSVLIKDRKDVRAAFCALFICGIALALLADIEIVFGCFIKNSVNYRTLQDRIAANQTLFAPSVVYTCTNDLAAFILMCFPLIFYRLTKASCIKEYVYLSVAALILLLPLPIINSTILNIALILLCVMAIAFMLIAKSNGKKLQHLIKPACVTMYPALHFTVGKSLIGKLFFTLNQSYFVSKILKLEEYTTAEKQAIIDALPKELHSDTLTSQMQVYASGAHYGTVHIRLSLIKYGGEFVLEKPLSGSGPMGYRTMLRNNVEYLKNTCGITDPHNFFIELVCQYGVILFAAYMALLVGMLIKALKHLLQELKDGVFGYGFLTILMLAAFAISSVMPSGFIRLTSCWLPFFITVLMVDVCGSESKTT